MPWSVLDHTGDLGLTIEHEELTGLFQEALRGFTDCLTEVARVRPCQRREVESTATRLDLLLVDWLGEALYLFDTETLVFSTAEIELSEEANGSARLVSTLFGEPFDASRHPLKTPIKAVTYHGLEVGPTEDGGWRARLVFDL